MNIIKDSMEVLKDLNIREKILIEYYESMKLTKEYINSKFNLNESNSYRYIIDCNLNDDTIKSLYPYTTKFINGILNGMSYSITNNYVFINDVKIKLTKHISSLENIELPYDVYTEINSNDLTTIFDVIRNKKIVISTNMYDFITSSTNTTFRSCYSINGCHFSGNFAYMLDDVTFIIYTYSNDINRKIGRSWGYLLSQDFFITSRTYGSIYKAEWKYIHETIYNLLGGTDWNLLEESYENYGKAAPLIDRDLPVYFDYTYTKIHFRGDYDDLDDIPFIEFVDEFKCINCGCETSNSELAMCEECTDSIYFCDTCNKPVHSKYFNHKFSLCMECYDKSYDKCQDCGKIKCKSDLIKLGNKIVCIDCLNKTHHKCKVCGKIMKNTKMINKFGIYICKICNMEYFICNVCERIKRRLNNDMEVCNDCNKKFGSIDRLRSINNMLSEQLFQIPIELELIDNRLELIDNTSVI